jgi:hypothetical protein
MSARASIQLGGGPCPLLAIFEVGRGEISRTVGLRNMGPKISGVPLSTGQNIRDALGVPLPPRAVAIPRALSASAISAACGRQPSVPRG